MSPSPQTKNRMYAPSFTVLMSSASASGISIENSCSQRRGQLELNTWNENNRRLASSTAITTSTASRLSKPKSLENDDVGESCTDRTCCLSTHTLHVSTSETHFCRVDLLEALQHIQHTRLNLSFGKTCGGRESCPGSKAGELSPGDGTGGEIWARSAAKSKTNERHFVENIEENARLERRRLRRDDERLKSGTPGSSRALDLY